MITDIIIAGGAGDQAAGAIGSGVINPNQSMISLGTSGVYFSPTSEFSSNTSKSGCTFFLSLFTRYLASYVCYA